MKRYLLAALMFLSPKMFALTHSVAAEDGLWSSVVEIEVDGKDQDGSLAPGYCVATLVRNNVLLTAAHCVSDALQMGIRRISVRTGHYVYHTRPDGSKQRIGYKPDPFVKTMANFLVRDRNPGPADDLAVVVLDQPMTLPADFPLAQITSSAEVSAVRSHIASYSPSVITINSMAAADTTDVRRWAQLNSFSFTGSGYYQSNSVARLEPGDSGGPVFVKIGTQWKLLATVKGQAKSYFSDWDVYESIHDNLCATVSGHADLQKAFCSN